MKDSSIKSVIGLSFAIVILSVISCLLGFFAFKNKTMREKASIGITIASNTANLVYLGIAGVLILNYNYYSLTQGGGYSPIFSWISLATLALALLATGLNFGINWKKYKEEATDYHKTPVGWMNIFTALTVLLIFVLLLFVTIIPTV